MKEMKKKTRVGEYNLESDSGKIDSLLQAPAGSISVLTATANL